MGPTFENKERKMKAFKKLMMLCIFIMATVSLTACQMGEPLDGEELVLAAREKYESYDSAEVVITNTDTGKVEQTFIFKYDEKDSLTYLYTGGYENDSYIQYNNGFECFTEQNGEYTFTQRGDTEFEAYTRSSKHPQASGAYLPFDRGSITKTEKLDEESGTAYIYTYDPESFEEESNVKSFEAEYHFDKNGDLVYFLETSDITDGDVTTRHQYKIEITQINSVKNIDNPLKDREK